MIGSLVNSFTMEQEEGRVGGRYVGLSCLAVGKGRCTVHTMEDTPVGLAHITCYISGHWQPCHRYIGTVINQTLYRNPGYSTLLET